MVDFCFLILPIPIYLLRKYKVKKKRYLIRWQYNMAIFDQIFFLKYRTMNEWMFNDTPEQK